MCWKEVYEKGIVGVFLLSSSLALLSLSWYLLRISP
jgi:hypothetical protein